MSRDVQEILLTLPTPMCKRMDKDVGVTYLSRQEIIKDALRQFYARKDLRLLEEDKWE